MILPPLFLFPNHNSLECRALFCLVRPKRRVSLARPPTAARRRGPGPQLVEATTMLSCFIYNKLIFINNSMGCAEPVAYCGFKTKAYIHVHWVAGVEASKKVHCD